MKHIATLVGLFALAASAHAQTIVPKPGSTNTVTFSSEIFSESLVSTTLNNGTRANYTTNSLRFGNREILETMRVANLLDGSVKGWSLSRVAPTGSASGLYAVKSGKTAVAVPATLLTEPAIQGGARQGVILTPTTGEATSKYNQTIFSTFKVQNGDVSAYGKRVVDTKTLKVGTTSYNVPVLAESQVVSGKSPSGTGMISGTYKVSGAKVLNLVSLLPAS